MNEDTINALKIVFKSEVTYWLSEPCACKLCAVENVMSQTAFFITDTDKPDNRFGIYCIIHGLLGYTFK